MESGTRREQRIGGRATHLSGYLDRYARACLHAGPMSGVKRGVRLGGLTDVGVVDLGLERENRRLEGVFFGEGDLDVEFAALHCVSVSNSSISSVRVSSYSIG